MKENGLKVRKGIEKNLYIKGLMVRHFYLYLMILLVNALILMFFIMGVLNGSTKLSTCFTAFFLLITELIIVYVTFSKAGKVKKYNYKKDDVYINNITLIKDLKK